MRYGFNHRMKLRHDPSHTNKWRIACQDCWCTTRTKTEAQAHRKMAAHITAMREQPFARDDLYPWVYSQADA